MNILSINNTNNFTSRYHKDTYRDRELFNDSRDKVTRGYSTYDGYDNTNSDFINDESDFDTETLGDKLLKDEYTDYGMNYFTQPIASFSMDDENNADLVEMSMLKTKDGEKFSGHLYNNLRKNADKLSPEDMELVVENSKLMKRNFNEYVDYNMLNAGFRIKEKLPNLSDEKFTNYMQSLIHKDERGNEVCDKSVLKILDTNSPSRMMAEITHKQQ